ncbi:MAG TPA: DotU family type IV/VI secretion system protein [Gammaproteobacteria bacterium]|nr:DotU family type IV/VI secretion system protein [Gammaproteobacteria bacterium]
MARQLTTNPLLECCTSLFALMTPFKAADRGAGIPEGYRENIIAGFNELERMAFEREITMQVVKDARYALAAYIDEVVLTSDWPGRLDWMAKPLQLEFFGEHLAGEGFFSRLAELRQDGARSLDLVELYYVCLQMGFEGVYRLKGIEQLMALQVDLRSQIESHRGATTARLSPNGLPKEGMLARARKEIPYWVIGTVTAAVFFFTYLGYSIAIQSFTESSVESIVSYHKQVDPGAFRPVSLQEEAR